MKIGIDISDLNDSQRTGIAVYIYELLNELIRLDQDDEFILFGIATFKTHNYLKNLDFKKYPNVKLKIMRWPARLFRQTFIAWQKFNFPPIEKLIGSIDIFHSFNWYLPPTKSAKSVGTFFDMTAITNPEWHLAKTTQMDKLLFKRMSKLNDVVITISGASKKDFLNYSPKSRVEVIYPAAAKIFNPAVNKNLNKKILDKYNLKSGFILSVSTLEPRKNLEGLIKAYLNLKTDAKLVLVGKSGWKNQELERLIERYKDKIISLGFVPENELPTLYQEAVFLIYPSFYEGFGIPILEAMSCGTPVIISNNSSMPEVGGEAAVYIDPYKTESMTKVMNLFLSDKKLLEKHRRLVLVQAKKFSWEVSAKKLIKLYKQI